MVQPEETLAEGVSVVVPVYNAEGTIAELCRRLIEVLVAIGRPFEIVLVEDRGRDASWDRINDAACADSRIRGIQMSRNYGQHSALLCGVREARYDVCVTLDDDLQHPPEEIPRLISALESGHDVVYGSPEHEQHGLLRDLASRITKMALGSAMGIETARKVSAFRAIRTPIREAFADFRGPFVVLDVLLTWGTTRFAAINVRHEPRAAGTSNYTLQMLVAHAVNMATGFSALPLQIASFTGFLAAIFGLGVLVYVFYMYSINGQAVPGFTFLASVIAIFSGVQLFAIGVIGEYLARMHFRLMDKPAYLVGAQTENTPRAGS